MTKSEYRRPALITITALVTVFACLIWVQQSSAAPFTPELEADYAAALAWWGVSSPPQCASVKEELLPTDPFVVVDGVEADARATQPQPGEEGVACVIYVLGKWLEGLAPVYGTATACLTEAVVRHEVGHLLGYGHSADPTNIMSPNGPGAACQGASEEAIMSHDAEVLAPYRAEERVEREDVARWSHMRRFARHHHFGLFDATRAH